MTHRCRPSWSWQALAKSEIKSWDEALAAAAAEGGVEGEGEEEGEEEETGNIGEVAKLELLATDSAVAAETGGDRDSNKRHRAQNCDLCAAVIRHAQSGVEDEKSIGPGTSICPPQQ